ANTSEKVATPIAISVTWNNTGLILPLSNLGYRKNSMKVKIAMFVPASVYERVTLTAARSSLIKCLRCSSCLPDNEGLLCSELFCLVAAQGDQHIRDFFHRGHS